jgi:hypothetical protein
MPYLPLTSLALPVLLALGWQSLATRGVLAARLLIIAFGLAALHQGAGVLGIADLQHYMRQGAGPQLFVSINIGLIVGGGLIPRPLLDWRQWLPGLPLTIGLALVLSGGPNWLGLILGGVLGAVPVALAIALPQPRSLQFEDSSSITPSIISLAVVVSVMSRSPLLLIFMLSVVAIIEAWLRNRAVTGRLTLPVLPIVAALLIMLAGVLSLSSAGGLLISVKEFLAVTPVSPSNERRLGFVLSAAVLTMSAPWPFHRTSNGAITLPAAIALGWVAANWLAPAGVLSWLPLFTGLLLASLLAAGGAGATTAMATSLAVLGALHGGTFGLAGAVVLTVWTVLSRRASSTSDQYTGGAILNDHGWVAALLIGGAAMVMIQVLANEIVLGTLLAAGLAFILAWRTPRGLPPRVQISIP